MDIDATPTWMYLAHFQKSMIEFSSKKSYQLLSADNFLKNTSSQIFGCVLLNILNHPVNSHEVAIPVSFLPKVILTKLFIFDIITSLFYGKTFKYHKGSYFYSVSMGREAMPQKSMEKNNEDHNFLTKYSKFNKRQVTPILKTL